MNQQPHVLILPFPVQGHVKPLLTLAELLCHAGLHVTFLNTEHNHRRLTHLQALSTDHFPTLHLESISDGLPADHPRGPVHRIPELISGIMSVTKPLFRELLSNLSRNSERPVTCVIVDGIMSFAIDFAKELGIRTIAFRGYPASSLWSFFCIPKLIEEGHVPVGDDDMDRMVTGIPGMEGLLRRRDLPSIFRQQLDNPAFQLFINEIQAMTQGSASLILNTFDNLEASMLSHLAPLFSKIYTIGPLNALLRSRIGEDTSCSLSSLTSLREADCSCMTWLDSQPLSSVVYVSFGSLAIMTRGQFMEIWHGLVNSGKPFLWVIRDDSIAGAKGESMIPMELQEGTKERGLFVEWALQEDVLAHPSVGGFFTHSGWNSTLESIIYGVPMICWPHFGDQQTNSRWVSEVWRIGLEMNDTCDRSTVETMIKTLMMKDKRAEIMESMDRIAKLAHDCVSQGGSSYHNLDNLIEDIRQV